jgi:hypothetical protein
MSLDAGIQARSSEPSRNTLVRTITAIDITADPALRGLWFPGHGLPADRAALAALPAGGTASPLGYWLVARDGLAPRTGRGPRLVVTAPDTELPELGLDCGDSLGAGRRSRTQTVRMKGPGPDGGKLVVTIGPGCAHVSAQESAWEALREPLILAICQVWRFQAIDAELEELTRSALENLAYANAPNLASLRQSGRLMGMGMKTRAAIVDVTYFQKPLTDPLAYFDSRRSARVYRLLADRFGLDDWSDTIDQSAEVVEGTFETITEKLYHLKSHAHDVVLEVMIVAILMLDVIMRIWEVIA